MVYFHGFTLLLIKHFFNNAISYYSVFSRLYIYLIGNYSFIYRKIKNTSFKLSSISILIIFFFCNTNNFYISDVIINVFAFLFLINKSTQFNYLLIEQIGNISYILYLIHYPLSIFNKPIYILIKVL